MIGRRKPWPEETSIPMKWILAAIAFVAGALLPLQALINARLGRQTTGGLYASACSFLVGTLALGALLLAMRQPVPSLDTLQRLPAWVWLGGVLGAFFVCVATLAIPRLGAATLVALVVGGQMVAALALDRFGVLQAPQPVGASRILGAVLVLAGVLLVMQPWKAR
jgi:transporter family-2 protein